MTNKKLVVLNVLHHIGPQVDGTIFQSFLDQVFRHSRQVIFEIERDSEQAVRRIAQESGFTVAHENRLTPCYWKGH